jgi:hypothetical protein
LVTCSPWLLGKDCRPGRGSDKAPAPSVDGPREGVTGKGSLCGDSTVISYSPGEEWSRLSSPVCTEMQQSVAWLDSLIPVYHEKGHSTETSLLTLGRISQSQ